MQFKLSILFISLLILASCVKEEKVENKTKPNIILFVSDDHGTDALGCYGNPVISTPNLDQLAAEGVKFNNAYCTSASCAASRAAILSGRYGHTIGAYGHTHDYHHFSTFDHVKSLPVLLEQAGYATARIGKYHLAPEQVYHFQHVLKADPRSTVEMAEACENIINTEKPFFLYFCTDDPHRGAPFQSNPWNLPNNFGNKKEGYPGVETKTYDVKDIVVPDFLPDTKECREELAEYYQSVSRIDQGFGKLMTMLKQAGKDKNTIVIYISDNGIAFPGAKTTVYEPGIKLPCIVKDPNNQKTGITNNAFISWIDLAPTILDYAQVETNEPLQGKSFKSILANENPEGWNTVYASHNFHELTMYYPMRVIRHNNFKLIWNIAWRLDYPFASDLWAASTWQSIYRNKIATYGQRKVEDYMFRPEFELYDLSVDPGEINNLTDKKEYAEILEDLKSKLRSFQKQTTDPWQIIWDHDATIQGSGVGL